MSTNGSPLGAYDTTEGTAIKNKLDCAQTPSHHLALAAHTIPPTPGTVHVPLSNGEVVVVDMQDSAGMNDESIASMSTSTKLDALAKMQAMMANMQSLMEKLQR